MSNTSFPDVPILMKRVTIDWTAHRRWTWDFLANLPDEELSLTDIHGDSAGEARLATYIAALVNQEQPLASLYASGWRFFERHPEMLLDFSEPVQAWPDLLQSIPFQFFKPLLWIFIGSQGSGTRLHQDVLNTHAWLSVIHGRKLIVLHPPENFENYDTRRGEALAIFHAAQDYGRWRYIELDPGDLLLIPSGWWHEVINEGLTLGLTRNFATPDIHERVALTARQQGLTSLLAWLDNSNKKAQP
jgi:hypothetical protein